MEPVSFPAPRPYAALPLGWAALLLYLTLAPAERLPPQPRWELLSFDTFAHAAFFAVQALLAWVALRRQRRWPALARRAGWVVLLGGTAFGAVIEVLQMVLPFNRHGEWSDLLSDTLGIVAALGLCYATAPALRRRGWAVGLVLLLAVPVAQAQDLTRARRTIEMLASPRMHGRGYVKNGDKKAAAYLRGRLRGLGLQPLAPDYMQPFVLDVNTFPGRLSVIYNVGKRHLYLNSNQFIAAANSPSARFKQLASIYFDTLAFGTNSQANFIRQELLALPMAHSALILSGRDKQRLPELPANLRQHLDSAAVWLRYEPKLTASLADHQSKRAEIEWLYPDVYNKNIRHISPISLLRRETIDVEIEAKLKRNYQTQNLAAVIRGTVQPDSFLVVSAHYDHLGTMGRKSYFPGANDNASGVALLLELAAHYARPENRPACSVVFLLFGAEEAGLLGSQYFVAHPLVPLGRIKFLVNLDLLGTGEQGATVVNGKIFPAAFARLSRLNAARHYLPGLGARAKAANSDHYPFSEAGVPAFFLYTRGGSTAYHDVNDQPAALSLAGFAGAFGLVRDFLNELGAATR